MSQAPTATKPTGGDEPWLEISSSRYFTSWLADHKIALAFTTYQAGKLFLVGRGPEGRPSVFERSFGRSMGLYADPVGQTLWLSTQYQLWRMENLLQPGEAYQKADRLYVPMVGHTTSDLDIHDVVVEDTGRVVFVATKFGCLATLAERASFTPLWKPPFLSKLAPEDRCHLNGLALDKGKARYVTCVSTSDVTDGWRDRRRDGGVIIDVTDNRIVASGLSMPHSPRVYRDQLWVLNSGTGYLGRVDVATGAFEPVSFNAGYLRGLAFVDDFAIVGLSKPRHDRTFGGLALDDELKKREAEPRCGLQVIDLKTGDIAHWLRLDGTVSELYDVAVLRGAVRPMALGFKTDEIQRVVSVGPSQPLA